MKSVYLIKNVNAWDSIQKENMADDTSAVGKITKAKANRWS